MIKQNLIYYPGGCYGTFIEWVFNFIENPTIDLPFGDSGTSHKFLGNSLIPKERVFEHIDSGKRVRYSRAHPGLFDELNQNNRCYRDSYDKVLQEELDFLKKNFDKLLVLNYDLTSILWLENNQLTKTFVNEHKFNNNFAPYGYTKEYMAPIMTAGDHVQRIKHTINQVVNSKNSPFTVENLIGWNKNNIYDFEQWDLRELLSFYWFTRNEGQIAAWKVAKVLNQDVLFVSISELKKNFANIILKIAEHFETNISSSTYSCLLDIYNQWILLQKQSNKDELCSTIIDALVCNHELNWGDSELSIIDEAWIQKSLRDVRIEIKCDGLNVFPTNSHDFQPLLIRNENRA